MDASRPGRLSAPGRSPWGLLGAFGVVVLAIEALRHGLDPLPARPGMLHLGLDALLLGATAGVVALVLRGSRGAHRELARETQELVALYGAALDVYGELDLSPLLQKIVDRAAELLGARYGAISVVDTGGGLHEFVTAGADPGLHGILAAPCKAGLIALVRDGRERVRIPDLAADPRHTPFPPGHPRMSSVLGVPVPSRGRYRGALFVGEKMSGSSFSSLDEDVLARFAGAAAIALDNADAHERDHTLAVLEERERIGRELHDGVAQTLAYVNAKAQAAELHLARGRDDEAGLHLAQLIAAAREAYADARASILDLRTAHGGERSFLADIEDYLIRWRESTGVEVEARVDPAVRVVPLVELQLARIIQEALANVRKHACAERVQVDIHRVGCRVVATVSDDGRGFDAAHSPRPGRPRFGLAIMKERAESVGGSLTVDSSAEGGTRVVLAVPAADPGE